MSQTIRDLFTDEEWALLSEELVPNIASVASLPLNNTRKEAEDDAT